MNNELDELLKIDGLQCIDSHLSIENFSSLFIDKKIYFQIISLKDSSFIWIGDDENEFNDISIAFQSSSYQNIEDRYSVTNLKGFGCDLESSRIALHLIKRTNRTCYVSYNVKFVPHIFEYIEKILVSKFISKKE